MRIIYIIGFLLSTWGVAHYIDNWTAAVVFGIV